MLPCGDEPMRMSLGGTGLIEVPRQRFARDVSPLTTIYTHPSDQELFAEFGRLLCC